MKPLARLHHLVVRLGLNPGRRLSAPGLLRFMAASLLSMLLWAGFLCALSLVAHWAAPH